jgi:hypothetical protein
VWFLRNGYLTFSILSKTYTRFVLFCEKFRLDGPRFSQEGQLSFLQPECSVENFGTFQNRAKVVASIPS